MKRVLVFLATTGLWLSAFMQLPVRVWNQSASALGKQDPAPQLEQDPKPQTKFPRVGSAITNNATPDRVIGPGSRGQLHLASPNRLLDFRGTAQLYSTDGLSNLSLMRDFSGWRDSWKLIIPGNFGGNIWPDLLFYDRAAGQGEFYTTDGQGNLTPLRQYNWRTTWDMIIPGNFGGDSRTDLLFYDRAAGQGEFYTTDGQGNLTLLSQHSWRTTWDMVIPGNFGVNTWPDLLFYDRAAGQGEFYTTDGQGNLTLLSQHSWRTTWDMIVPGNFGGPGLGWTDLLFYQR
jgi:hypothetical protein